MLPVKASSFPQRRLEAEQDGPVFPVPEGFPGTEGFSVPEEPGLSFPRAVVSPEKRAEPLSKFRMFFKQDPYFPLVFVPVERVLWYNSRRQNTTRASGPLLPPGPSGLGPRCAICPPQARQNERRQGAARASRLPEPYSRATGGSVRELPTAGPRIADPRAANCRPQGRESPIAGLRIRLLYGRGQNSKTPLRYRPQGGRFLTPGYAAGGCVRELLPAGPRTADRRSAG